MKDECPLAFILHHFPSASSPASSPASGPAAAARRACRRGRAGGPGCSAGRRRCASFSGVHRPTTTSSPRACDLGEDLAERVEDHRAARLDRVVVHADRVGEHVVDAVLVRPGRQPAHQPAAPLGALELHAAAAPDRARGSSHSLRSIVPRPGIGLGRPPVTCGAKITSAPISAAIRGFSGRLLS